MSGQLLDRPAAAFAAGFEAIEPFAEPVPADHDVDALVDAVTASGTRLVGLNFWPGDLTGPDCGVASLPDRANELVTNVDVAVSIGERLGVQVQCALRQPLRRATTPEAQLETATWSLTVAASVADRIGATVLIEPISGPKPYPLRTAADAVEVVDRMRAIGVTNIGLLCDVFHLAANGDLHHACLSTWLNAGVPAVQVAQWAGHTVAVLLHIYAKCVEGQDEVAKRRIEDALDTDSTPAPPASAEAKLPHVFPTASRKQPDTADHHRNQRSAAELAKPQVRHGFPPERLRDT